MEIPNSLMVGLALLLVCISAAIAQTCTEQEERTLRKNCIESWPQVDTVCNGRGDCVCGTCSCHTRSFNTLQRYSGSFCECDDYSCRYHDTKLCGGNGVCDCGVCKCFDGWKGIACECPTKNDACIAANGQVCNNSGNCVCGSCKCSSWTEYFGPTCEDCPSCPGLCNENRNCALCKGFGIGPYDSDKCDTLCTHVRVADAVERDEKNVKKPTIKLCNFIDEDDGCSYEFSYKYIGNTPHITVSSNKVCPQRDSPVSSAQRSRHLGSGLILATTYGLLLATWSR